MMNIDYLTARFGQEIIENSTNGSQLEKVINAALDILNKQGIYALFLWLYAKDERFIIGQKLNELFQNEQCPVQIGNSLFQPENSPATSAALTIVREQLTGNVRIMFFAQDIIDQTLIYARHRAKAA